MSSDLEIAVTAEMLANREIVLSIYGRKALDETVKMLRIVAEKKGLDPFRLAIDESLRAGREGKEVAAIQIDAAACEIAETAHVWR